ncbi:GNAT family N-acetyltransferase [Microvirga pudoricolor]|uniref:GNAT family N-acetyltransferase n=1 Tax=Microvirga pudoricolor TaxID=2778729 RepID=UPI00194ED9DC|nr:N-acetyltransferase [Microvirga pudoricolor]MBM6594572.1 GNAT family N-acetyltransferase [Microvirga pudoricolor]
MVVDIRPALPDDAADLARIGLAAWLKGIGPHVPDAVRGRMVRDNPFVPFIREMGPGILVATVNGHVAGLAACEHSDDLISDLWVSPDHEGRGAGSALVRALEREIAARGHAEARLEVLAANSRAASLYERLGYQRLWQAVRYDAILAMDLDKIGLGKPLPPG